MQIEKIRLWLRHDVREDQQLKFLQQGQFWPHPQDPSVKEIEAVLEWLDEPQHHLIAYGDPLYPELLSKIDQPPPFLSVWGNLEVLHEPQLGMVGCRNMSHYGAENAFAFAKALSEIGLVVTSGLARGIDALSHEGAMQGGGATIAVLGTGLCQVYPRDHQNLAAKIAEKGAVISQFPLHNGPFRHQFPMRNRVISGLSMGVLVVEAAQKSGSLITARYALQQNREVFAVPGSIHSVTSKGCHALIRQGATLVESLPDLLIELKSKLSSFTEGVNHVKDLKKAEGKK